MGKIDRRSRWLFAAGELGAAWVVSVLLVDKEQTSTVSPPTPASTAAALPQSSNVIESATTTAPAVKAAPIGVRQNYIVQAASAEAARSAVNRAGGIVTGDLE